MKNVGQTRLSPFFVEAYRREVTRGLKPLLPEIFSSLQHLANKSRSYLMSEPEMMKNDILENLTKRGLGKITKEKLDKVMKIYFGNIIPKEVPSLNDLFLKILEFPLFFEYLILGAEQPYAVPIFSENRELFEHVEEYRSNVDEYELQVAGETLSSKLVNGVQLTMEDVKIAKEFGKNSKLMHKLFSDPFFLLYMDRNSESVSEEIQRISELIEERAFPNGFPKPQVWFYTTPYQVAESPEYRKKIILVEPKEPSPLESFDDYSSSPLEYEDMLKKRIQKLKTDLIYYTTRYRLSSIAESFIEHMKKNWIDVIDELQKKQPWEIAKFINELFDKPFVIGRYSELEEELQAFGRRYAYRKSLEDRLTVETAKFRNLPRPTAYERLVLMSPAKPMAKQPSSARQSTLTPSIEVYQR